MQNQLRCCDQHQFAQALHNESIKTKVDSQYIHPYFNLIEVCRNVICTKVVRTNVDRTNLVLTIVASSFIVFWFQDSSLKQQLASANLWTIANTFPSTPFGTMKTITSPSPTTGSPANRWSFPIRINGLNLFANWMPDTDIRPRDF